MTNATQNLILNNIAANVETLRTEHKIPIEIMTEIFPERDNILQIADFFGISLDWLLNRSTIKYNEELLFNLERNITNTLKDMCRKQKTPILTMFLKSFIFLSIISHKNYILEYERATTFDDKDRAEIIYHTNIFMFGFNNIKKFEEELQNTDTKDIQKLQERIFALKPTQNQKSIHFNMLKKIMLPQIILPLIKHQGQNLTMIKINLLLTSCKKLIKYADDLFYSYKYDEY